MVSSVKNVKPAISYTSFNRLINT